MSLSKVQAIRYLLTNVYVIEDTSSDVIMYHVGVLLLQVGLSIIYILKVVEVTAI